jgi:hypothetical protein
MANQSIYIAKFSSLWYQPREYGFLARNTSTLSGLTIMIDPMLPSGRSSLIRGQYLQVLVVRF